jgi:group I intron endonuclease
MTTFGFIYKITNSIDERIYVGSTTRVNKRLSLHKNRSNNPNNINTYNMKICQAMRELGRDNFSIHIIENVEYSTKEELRQRERYWIEELKPDLNSANPFTTVEETKERVKQWHTDNKEHVKKYKQEHYLKNKDKITAAFKDYYSENKEKLKDYQKELRKNSEVVECGCGGKYKKIIECRHLRTKKHQNWLNPPPETPIPSTHNKCECGSIYKKRDKWQHIKTKKHLASKNKSNQSSSPNEDSSFVFDFK